MNTAKPPAQANFKFTNVKAAVTNITAAAKSTALNNAARAYSVQCANKAKMLETQFVLHKIHRWQDLGIDDVPLHVASQPMTFANLKAFLVTWCGGAEARFKAQEALRLAELTKVSTKFTVAQAHGITKEIGRAHV